jgi:hypothetical protein
MDGYCFDPSTETKKRIKMKFQISKSSLLAEGKREDPVSRKEDRPHSEFSGHARNLIEFSCWNALASCTSNCSQIRVTPFFTPVILLYSKRVILLYSKRPHGTSIRSGEDATSRSINLASLILAADETWTYLTYLQYLTCAMLVEGI